VIGLQILQEGGAILSHNGTVVVSSAIFAINSATSGSGGNDISNKFSNITFITCNDSHISMTDCCTLPALPTCHTTADTTVLSLNLTFTRVVINQTRFAEVATDFTSALRNSWNIALWSHSLPVGPGSPIVHIVATGGAGEVIHLNVKTTRVDIDAVWASLNVTGLSVPGSSFIWVCVGVLSSANYGVPRSVTTGDFTLKSGCPFCYVCNPEPVDYGAMFCGKDASPPEGSCEARSSTDACTSQNEVVVKDAEHCYQCRCNRGFKGPRCKSDALAELTEWKTILQIAAAVCTFLGSMYGFRRVMIRRLRRRHGGFDTDSEFDCLDTLTMCVLCGSLDDMAVVKGALSMDPLQPKEKKTGGCWKSIRKRTKGKDGKQYHAGGWHYDAAGNPVADASSHEASWPAEPEGWRDKFSSCD
jgi:hypothetical protein